MSLNHRDNSKFGEATRLTRVGRDPAAHAGAVNTPVYRASTFVWDSVAEQEDFGRRMADPADHVIPYGRLGNPTTQALEDAVAELEGGFRGLIAPSGLAAISGALLASLEAGDHALIVDSCYWNTRKFCDLVLKRAGIEVSYYDPAIGAGIAALIKPNTRVVYVESPGSQTFEIQDVPAIAQAAHKAGAIVILDNTWATPLFFKPFDHGVDISIQAATKYIVGHSDAMLGLITTTKELYIPTRTVVRQLGYTAGGDDAYLGLRGLRTLDVRLQRHFESGVQVAEWLQGRGEVAQVLHPALPSFPGHALWKRDFTGASGLFSIVLKSFPKAAIDAFMDGLELFGMGASWGGYESLVKREALQRSAGPAPEGVVLRLHVGLEDPDDLIADLAAGLDRLSRFSEAA